MGDRLLSAIADRLFQNTRDDRSWVGRLGGDEFAVVPAGCPPQAGPSVALRLQTCISEPVIVGGVALNPACSIGYTFSDGAELDCEELMARADLDMYATRRARREGLAGPVEEFRHALDAGQLITYLQPVWSIGPEIPENSQIMKSLNDLRREGVQIALDDFGSGYAGLNNLRTLPIDNAKIDRSLTATLAEDSPEAANAEHVLGGIRQLTHAMGKQLLTEGIENFRRLELIQKLGFDYVQGFLLRPPRAGDLHGDQPPVADHGHAHMTERSLR